MAYADLATIQTIATGQVITAALLDQARDNEEFLVAPPQCSVYDSNATFSVSDDTLTALPADSENYDLDGMHSTSTNNTRITIQTAGKYELSYVVAFASDADGYRLVEFFVNGTTRYTATTMQTVTVGTITTVVSGSRRLALAAADYVEVRVRHTAGAALNVDLREFAAKFDAR